MTNKFFDLNSAEWLSASVVLVALVMIVHVEPFCSPRRDDNRRRTLAGWLLDYWIPPVWEEPPEGQRHRLSPDLIRAEDEAPDGRRLTRQEWRDMIDRPAGGGAIGAVEMIFFYGTFLAPKPEAIAAWLAFKVVAKWDTWKNVVQWPDSLPGQPQDQVPDAPLHAAYIGAKNQIGGWLGGRFTIGTLLNILYAFGGYVVYLGFAWLIEHICPI